MPRSVVSNVAAFVRLANFIPGFGDRLLNEVKKLALKDVKIKIYAPPERKYSTWIGGSILAGLGAFKKVRLSLHISFVISDRFTDVDICGGIPGRSRYYSQKIRILDSVVLLDSHSFLASLH